MSNFLKKLLYPLLGINIRPETANRGAGHRPSTMTFDDFEHPSEDNQEEGRLIKPTDDTELESSENTCKLSICPECGNGVALTPEREETEIECSECGASITIEYNNDDYFYNKTVNDWSFGIPSNEITEQQLYFLNSMINSSDLATQFRYQDSSGLSEELQTQTATTTGVINNQ